jgi:hypothetical protein
MEKKSCPGCGGMFVPVTGGGLRAHGPVGNRCTQALAPITREIQCGECREFKPVETNPRGIRAHAAAGKPCHGVAVDGTGRSVSDQAPTVDETTTHLGNGVYGGLETHRGAKESCPGPDCGETQGDDVAEKGPWFGAMYEGRCSVSECRIYEGDRIRADGEGGYECEDCGMAEVIMQCAPDEVLTPGAMYSEPTEEAVTDAMPFNLAAQEYNDTLPTPDQFLDPAPVSRGYANLTNTAQYAAQYGMTADQFLDPADTAAVEPVMGVNGQPKKVRRDHMKRYAVVLPGETELERYATSGKPKGRTRATTFNKAATDKKNINDWGKRNVVIGASRRRDLLLKAQGLTHEQDRDRLNAIVVELEEAAGSKVGSDLGTFLHEFTEYMDAGLKTWEDAPAEFRVSLRRYKNALISAGLEPITSLIERTTIIREFGWVCGTFDRIFYHRPSGQYVIGDLKTGKTMDYGKNEIEAQLWIYAHGVNQNGIYDWNTDTWHAVWDGVGVPNDKPPFTRVSESVGVVIHMPVQGPREGTVELLRADLEAGKAHAELCHQNRSQPKGKMRAWGDGPAPVAPPSWEDRFGAVTSGEEASALWVQAKADATVDAMRLQDLILSAQQRLRELGGKG